MAQITIEEIYRGEKYNVLSAVLADCMTSGIPGDCDEKTWLGLQLAAKALLPAKADTKPVTE